MQTKKLTVVLLIVLTSQLFSVSSALSAPRCFREQNFVDNRVRMLANAERIVDVSRDRYDRMEQQKEDIVGRYQDQTDNLRLRLDDLRRRKDAAKRALLLRGCLPVICRAHNSTMSSYDLQISRMNAQIEARPEGLSRLISSWDLKLFRQNSRIVSDQNKVTRAQADLNLAETNLSRCLAVP